MPHISARMKSSSKDLESDENESEGNESKVCGKMDEDSIVLAEAERILDKHLSAFKELAR